MAIKIIDDKFESLDDDIQKVQIKPTTYISYTGDKGALHLAKEAINNMIDECLNKNAIGKTIKIFLDESENTLSVSDNSRGIPFDVIEKICTTMHSGSKITREGTGGSSAGENGIGLTAINALASLFQIISTRNGETASIKFEEGVMTQELTIEKADPKEHGTTCIFAPTKKYLGKYPRIKSSELYEWVEKISYTIPDKDIVIILDINKIGKEASVHKVFRNTNGLAGLMTRVFDKKEELALEPINIFNHTKTKETIIDINTTKDKEVERFFGIEVAFSYKQSRGEIYTDSFCNMINTIDDGTHIDGVKDALQRYLKKKVKDAFSEKESKTYDINSNDVYNGLCLMVNIGSDLSPGFASQTKEKVGSPVFEELSKKLTLDALTEYFDRNPKELKKVTDFIKTSIKMRMALVEAKKSVVKDNISNIDKHDMTEFKPCNGRGKSYKELLIVEGDSAKGSADIARYKDFQALFILKGVPENTYNKTLIEVVNGEFKNFLRILGCNVGHKYDESKLEYDKVIILTDADVDGKMISSLLSVLFIKHLPKLVENGHVYKAISPLYKLNDKETPYVIDKKHYVEVVEKKVSKALRIFDARTNKMYDSEMLRQFLLINRDYFDELSRVATNLSIDALFLERLIMVLNSKDLNKAIQEYYPEITIENDYLSGIVDGQYQILVLDRLFRKKIKKLVTYIHEINKNRMNLIVCDIDSKGEITNTRGEMTVGEFMILYNTFNPEIVMRYKGLGELEHNELRETTLNPSQRFLYKLSIADLERDIEIFETLHGNSVKARSERKELMKHAKISREEFDN